MLSVAVLVLAAWSCDDEDARVRAHLEDAYVQLQTVVPAGLSPEQREGRAAALRRLRAYIDAGRYPRNHSSKGATPVFVDGAGTHCAMGQLLEDLGGREVVTRIHAARNLETVPVLADEPGLAGWLLAHGLTPEEAALVQPTYFYCQPLLPCADGVASVYDAVLLRSDAGAPWRETPIRVLRGANVCAGEELRFGYYDSELSWPAETVLGEPFALAHDGTGWVSPVDANCAQRPRLDDAERALTDRTACVAALARRDLRWLAVECFNSGWPIERLRRCNPDGRYRAGLLPPRGTMRAALDAWFTSLRIDPADAGIDLSGYQAMEELLWERSDDGGLPFDGGPLAVRTWDGGSIALDQACVDARDAGQAVDAGMPADAGGEPDAGGPDAGTEPGPDAGALSGGDAGREPTPPPAGCGCTSGEALGGALALGALLRRRRPPPLP